MRAAAVSCSVSTAVSTITINRTGSIKASFLFADANQPRTPVSDAGIRCNPCPLSGFLGPSHHAICSLCLNDCHFFKSLNVTAAVPHIQFAPPAARLSLGALTIKAPQKLPVSFPASQHAYNIHASSHPQAARSSSRLSSSASNHSLCCLAIKSARSWLYLFISFGRRNPSYNRGCSRTASAQEKGTCYRHMWYGDCLSLRPESDSDDRLTDCQSIQTYLKKEQASTHSKARTTTPKPYASSSSVSDLLSTGLSNHTHSFSYPQNHTATPPTKLPCSSTTTTRKLPSPQRKTS